MLDRLLIWNLVDSLLSGEVDLSGLSGEVVLAADAAQAEHIKHGFAWWNEIIYKQFEKTLNNYSDSAYNQFWSGFIHFDLSICYFYINFPFIDSKPKFIVNQKLINLLIALLDQVLFI